MKKKIVKASLAMMVWGVGLCAATAEVVTPLGDAVTPPAGQEFNYQKARRTKPSRFRFDPEALASREAACRGTTIPEGIEAELLGLVERSSGKVTGPIWLAAQLSTYRYLCDFIDCTLKDGRTLFQLAAEDERIVQILRDFSVKNK